MAAQQVLHWPTETDQKITVPYNQASGSIEIAAQQGTPIRAVMSGKIAATADNWLQISSESFVATMIGLQNMRVQPGQNVNGGDEIAEAAGNIKLQVYQNIDPTERFEKISAAAPPTTTPTPEPPVITEGEDQPIFLTPTRDGLRVREQPVDGKPVGQLKLGEVVESLESVADTHSKVGVDGQWLNIRRYDGTTAYTAAWFLRLSDQTMTAPAGETPAKPIATPTSSSLLGMNLDVYHPQGHPAPEAMKGIGWVRIKFNVSFNPENGTYGNKDIEAAYQRYLPLVKQYAGAGMKVLMVFTHQLYGEGAGFNWTQMDSGRWRHLGPTYADFARQVAAKFNGSGLVHCYQIWNEQDTKPEHARAAVPIPAADYGYLMTETIRAIRSVDSTTPIITGGHTTGPGSGPQYAQATLAAMPPDVRPDGIAFHPYGRGVKGHRFSNWGPLADSLNGYSAVLPDIPIWITEWGVLDHQGRADVIDDVTDYAAGFMNIVKNDYPGKVAAVIWYAWADGMDNGFGLVDAGGQSKPRFNDKWRTLG